VVKQNCLTKKKKKNFERITRRELVPIHIRSHYTMPNTMGVNTSTIGPRWKVGSIEVEKIGRRGEWMGDKENGE
jgi:hypothetical protein